MNSNNFLSNVATNLNVFMTFIQLAIEGIINLGSYFEGLAPIADMLFYTVIATGALVATQAIWGMVKAIGASIAAFAVAHPAILAVAFVIGSLIAITKLMGVTMVDVIVGAIGAWFGFLNMMGRVQIGFKEAMYGMGTVLDNFVVKALLSTQGLINDFLGGVDALSDAIKMYTGIDLGHTNKVSFADEAKKAQDLINRQRQDEIVNDKDRLLRQQTEREEKLGEYRIYWEGKLGKQELPESPLPNGLDNIGTIDKVNKLGKIDTDVNIADEDMKMLMELAIQNRVNQINLTVNTDAPQVTNNNSFSSGNDVAGFVDALTKGISESRQVMVEQAH